MISPEVLLTILQSKGPSVPNGLKKEVRMDSLLISAMLSNLVSTKKVKLSYLKVGTSPLYYLPGQEAQLENFIGKLDEKQRRVVERLKGEVVLRDRDLSPVERFSLGEAKDFAEQLTVTVGGTKETFWKYFLANDNQTTQQIRSLLTVQKAPAAPKPKEIVIEEPVAEKKPEAPKIEKPEPKVEKPQPKVEKIESKIEKTPEVKVEPTKEKSEERKVTPVGKAVRAIKDFIAPEKSVVIDPENTDPFYLQIMQFFVKENISVLHQECIRKKSEYDFKIVVDSPLGPLNYYCKAKSKKRLSEGDISTIYLKAQGKNLPTVLLTTGELSKNATLLLQKELKGLTVKKI